VDAVDSLNLAIRRFNTGFRAARFGIEWRSSIQMEPRLGLNRKTPLLPLLDGFCWTQLMIENGWMMKLLDLMQFVPATVEAIIIIGRS